MASTGEPWRLSSWSAVAIIGVAALLLLNHFAVFAKPEPRTVIGKDFVVAGAIRPDASCHWRVIDWHGHHPTGISSVTTDDQGHVVVHYSEVGSAVVTFVATPDETMAAQGYRVGASVDSDQARITISPAPRCDQFGQWANIWVYGLMER